ncbi:hypothetical protein FRB90_001901 [Tulasnella sp. 427]|nr:hypothetical protein FRB90_001901 [Tulasnella sp. 427]
MDASPFVQGDNADAIMNDSFNQLLRRLGVSEVPVATRSQINRNIATLDEVLCFYTKSIRTLQSELRRRQNEIARINQLPMEIVLDIFFITVGGWDDWDVYSVLK